MKWALNRKRVWLNIEGLDDLIQTSAVSLLFSEEKYSIIRVFDCIVKPFRLLSVLGESLNTEVIL